MSDIQELKPARPDAAGPEPKSYMPSLPWAWIVGGGLFFSLAVGMCHIRDKNETDALRKTVLTVFDDQLGGVANRYRDVADKIRSDTAGAAARPEAATYVDPRLKLDALGSSKGLYLRVPAEAVKKPEQIASASLDMEPDAIGRCLGLSPLPVPELFARGQFLEKEWIKRADEADSVMKLRVVAEELRQRSERDLPFLAEAVNAQWFLLVLEHGDNRRDAPVDAYLWDLRDNKLLLSTRAKASGTLVSARISVGGVKPGNYASGAQSGAAQDCSIASQLRALAGDAPTTFAHAAPAPRDAMGIAPLKLETAQDAGAATPTTSDAK